MAMTKRTDTIITCAIILTGATLLVLAICFPIESENWLYVLSGWLSKLIP
jgi:hypothetical protein